jgi:signal transduction histidine kinase
LLHSQPTYKANLIFETEIEDGDFISINGNEYLLKVAFINLIENGCKFSTNKESTITINCFKERTILRFRDSGIGIADEELPYIFKPFHRGLNKKYADGHGIGLSLTKKIITLHQGSIYITSKLNEGSMFTVELPHY